ncbi:MAG: M23 family metallopeptidase [Micrococcales bacterium]|nr:M23 family metallopeptidase [Micrococcales bacterium]
MAGPATTTIIKTKHLTAPTTPRHRRLAIVGGGAVATLAAVAISFGFLVPNASPAPLELALPLTNVARTAGGDTANLGLAQDANSVSTLLAVDSSAAGAVAADATVKQVQADAAKVASSASQHTLSDAQSAWAKANNYNGSSRIDYSTNDLSGTPVDVPDGAFIWPVSGFTITSGFGWRTDPVYGGPEFHSGLDLAAPCGTPIYASGAGTVTYAGWNGSFGYYVEINHGDLSTGYGHQSKVVATVGEQVAQGQLIGYVGATGKATGCHVHFQAINGAGKYFNPQTLIH